ncbi:MAG: imidazole glycerol phosphate synthase subunit HisF [Phycisphaeraceae bacterium]|nr:imidazole glycerol phosphate synthase subunit HisF [Phycisphaeraceae bacterium]MCW5763965.1 imidazole glycerol phosphate synthase subunit HisF [Phycisphaeraceae bacterium]
MLKQRIIPCLDIRDGRVVKGVRFASLRDAGDPVEQASRYEADGADEIVMLDISATLESRRAALHTIGQLRAALSIPLSVGGGIRTIDDALAMLDAGADKIALNSAAVNNPRLIADLATRVGTQCVVLSIDAASHAQNAWHVVTRSGSHRTTLDAIDWARTAQSLGAGEILLTSFDRDGCQSGYDLNLIAAVADSINLPIIASGGAGSAADMLAALSAGAHAVLAASIFHDQLTTIATIKSQLAAQGIEIRS